MSKATINPTANFTSPFRLYDLPQELCDLIFAESSTNLPKLHKITRKGESTITVELVLKYRREDTSRLRVERFPPYMLSHKHFYHDLFTYGGWMAKCESVHPLTSIYLSSESMAETALRGARWNLSSTGCLCRRKRPASQQIFIDAGFSESLQKSSSLLHRLWQCEMDRSGARTLFVAFGLDTWSFREVDVEAVVDLSGLELVADGIDRVVVEVAVCGFRDQETQKELCKALEKGVDRFGFALFGEARATVFELDADKTWRGELYTTGSA